MNKQNPKIFQFSQVVRKSRSKILYSSGKATTKTSGSESTEASCLSSSSTAGSSARSRISCYVSRGEKRLAMVHEDEEIRRKNVSSTHMRRRADSILKLLSGGCSSELKIRQLLGDSPDTSKALRMWSFSLSLNLPHGVFECVTHVACESSPICLLGFCLLTNWSVWTWLIISTVWLHHIIGRLKNAFTHTGCYEWSTQRTPRDVFLPLHALIVMGPVGMIDQDQ